VLKTQICVTCPAQLYRKNANLRHPSAMCYTVSLTACEQEQDVPMFHPDPARKLSAKLYDISLLCVQWKTPDDGERNCPKHVELHSKNKCEKLEHLVGFIIRNLTRCTVTWTSHDINLFPFTKPIQCTYNMHSNTVCYHSSMFWHYSAIRRKFLTPSF